MAKKLTKELGLLGVFAISTGAMISSGLFVLPGIAAAQLGPAVVYAYLLSGLLILPSLLSMAELSTAMPRAGGTYFFVSRSLGTMFGTIEGVGDWLALILKSSIAIAGLGYYLAEYLPLPMQAIAIVACIVFLVVNLIGAKETAGLQIGMVMLMLLILAILIIWGLPAIEPANTTPLAPFGMGALLPVTAMVFVSYIGLTKVASVAEEVRKPERNIPLGMILSLVVVMAVYGLAVWVVVGVVPATELHGSFTPLNDAGALVLGKAGGYIVSFAAILAFATTGNAALLASSRYLLAMSRDHAMPHRLSRLSSAGTPRNAIVLTSAVVVCIVCFVNLENIAKLASAFQLLVFAFVNVSVIVMRESGIESYDPGFKCPFYPYVQVIGIIIAVVLIPEMGLLSSAFAFALLVLGIAWYNLYVRHKVVRVGAVAQLAQRVAERLLRRDAEELGLDRELREILKEKGLRARDPFAEMVQRAAFLEIGSHMDMEKVISSGARILAENSGVSENIILDTLLQRSRLGETPAEAGIALPHLLLDDIDEFHMVVARSVHGMYFDKAGQTIHAVFILLGDKKNPTQHLRFLAEIARRAELPHFIEDWVKAKSERELRELLQAKPGE
jgi:amino acid transporter/mannitol/fructose-specific phosphotransferase system IIA component (Ntr-type)